MKLMKKKKTFLIVVVLLVLSFALAGCDMFTIDGERDYKQSVASLTVDGVEVNITKGQLNETFAQNFQTYSQYGLSAEDILNLSLVNLAKREILIVVAKDFYGDKTSSAYDLLSDNEKAWVMKTTNKMFSDTLDSEVKEKSKDKYNSSDHKKDDKDKDDEPLVPARGEYTEPEESTNFKEYEKYDFEEDFFTQMADAEGIEKEAVDEIKEDLKDQYKDYNYFKERNAEGRLLTKYQDTHKGVDIEISEEELTKEYGYVVKANKTKYLKGSSYATDIENDKGSILYHKGQYFKVKSVLLGFSEDQEAIYKNRAAQFPSESQATANEKYRTALVTGGTAGSEAKLLLDQLTSDYGYEAGAFDKGLLINISNLNYKSGAYCTDENCECHKGEDFHKQLREDIENKVTRWGGETGDLETPLCKCPMCEFNAYVAYNVPYTAVLNMIAADVAKAETDAITEYNDKYKKATFNEDASVVAGRKMFVSNKKLEMFDKWIYRVNDDPGMMDGKEYLVTPAGQESSYVPEYTALARAIISNEQSTKGSMTTDLTNYQVGNKNVDIKKESKDGSSVSYIINDFGVHIIMISTLPLDFNLNAGLIDFNVDVNPDFDIDDYNVSDESKKAELIKVNQIFQLKESAFVSFDEETGKALKYSELKKDTYIENAKTETYNKFEIKLFEGMGEIEDFFNKANKKGITLTIGDKTYNVTVEKDKGVYNQLAKEAKKADKLNAQRGANQQ